MRRMGQDLYLSVDIPLRDALLGGSKATTHVAIRHRVAPARDLKLARLDRTHLLSLFQDVPTIDDRLLKIKFDGVMQASIHASCTFHPCMIALLARLVVV